MVIGFRLFGLTRGDWILTAYFAAVAASGMMPPALVVVEVGAQPGGAMAAAIAAVASVLAGVVTMTTYTPVGVRAASTGALARALAIPFVSRWLMHGTNLRRLTQRHGASWPETTSRPTLQDVVDRSLLAERAHAAGISASLPWIVVAARFGAPGLAVFVAAVTITFQLYPVLVQRETRRRVQAILTGWRRRR
jgi:hypothetical protein